jgi:D-3-phosphoglycerate dehydrogenase
MMESVFAANYERDVLWAYDIFRARLRERGMALVLAECATDDEVVSGAADAAVYLAYRRPVTRRVLERLPQLRLVIASGSGYDHIDVSAAAERGIVVCNSATYNVEDVAEHTLMLVMACGRKLRLLEAMVRAGVWPLAPRALPRHRFAGSALGVIGFGKIGRAVVSRARALGMRVLVTDPYVAPDAIGLTGGEPVGIDELLARADFVSLHLRLSAETHHLIDADALARMKPTAYLINASRGGLVDERALIDALRLGRIAGAGLDVLEEEPPAPTNPLLSMDNVIVTGHTAGSTVESIHALVDEWLRIIDAFRAGGPPVNAVTPEVTAPRQPQP